MLPRNHPDRIQIAFDDHRLEPRPSRLQFPHPLLLSSRRPSVDSG